MTGITAIMYRKSRDFGCLPRLIEKHRFIFIVDSNHRADEWGPPFPRQVLHPTSICAVNPAPVDTTQRKKPTHSSINLKGMATQDESTCRLHHYLHLLHLHYSIHSLKTFTPLHKKKDRK